MLEKAEITIENLLSKVKYYYQNDFDIINQAFLLAQESHKGQLRSSGRPYITHPVVVADILVDLGLDVPAICAALLHDTVEDTTVTDEKIRKEFGNEVADLVKGVTKLDKLQFASKEEEQAENIRKMFFAMAKDIRVLVIKLADRLHNMRSLQYLPLDRQLVFAKETMDIYAPLAGRLGISPIKCELEDLCLKFLDRPTYDYLASNIALKRDERQELVDLVIHDVNTMLIELEVKGEVSGRTKHFYSIYKKMKNQGKTLDQIYDLTAVRVIVETVKDCYNVLGSIHAKWKPIPGRFKDYIAVPKPNMYQSLHTTVVTESGMPFEIQIRTVEMHRIAEYGIAAHWKYKEGLTKAKMDEKLGWVKEVLGFENDLKNSSEFLDLIRKDLSITNEVYVFTPKGDVRSLSAGATGLDFAYAVHSEVGNKCVGVKINNKICPLDRVLNNGDLVEVLTSSQSKGPSRDWLKIVKTAGAKAKIRQFFKRELKDEYVKIGHSMLEREARRRGYSLSSLLTESAIKAVFDRYLFESLDEMSASVGYGGISVNQIIPKLISVNGDSAKIVPTGELLPSGGNSSKLKDKSNSVIIKGFDDLLIRFSKCCAPVPGDEIIGYISRGRGITIHRADCPSVKTLEKERLVEASWATANAQNATFVANIQIVSEDRGEVFANITKVVSNEKIPLLAINARKDKNHNAIAIISVEINNNTQLQQIITKLKGLPTTLQVFRTTN